MGLAVDIVKQRGARPTEAFDPAKLHASILAACLSVRSPEGEAETIAKNVVKGVVIWLELRPEVTSQDLRRVASHHLKKYHPEAAYLYEQHTNII